MARNRLGNSCVAYPVAPNGEISTMYRELLQRTNNRPLTNLIYASYSLPGVEAMMNGKGYVKNSQGEYDADAVIKEFNVNEMLNQGGLRINNIEVREGTKHTNGNFIDFTDSSQALQKAQDINQKYDGVAATVVRKGSIFNVVTSGRDSRTLSRVNDVDKNVEKWKAVTNIMSQAGVNMDDLSFYPEVFNALGADNVSRWLNNLNITPNDLLAEKEIRSIFVINSNSTEVQRLITKYGTIEQAANEAYKATHNLGNYTSGEKALINNTIDVSKQFRNIDKATLSNQLAQINQTFDSNDLAELQTKLEELDSKYNININEVFISPGEKIKSLSRANQEALLTIERQLDKELRLEGKTQKAEDLMKVRDRLAREIDQKKYYSGALSFLTEALDLSNYFYNALNSAIQTNGTQFERASAIAKVVEEFNSTISGYDFIVEALSNIDSLGIDENINQIDLDTLKAQASTILHTIEEVKRIIEDSRKEAVVDIIHEYTGDSVEPDTLINMVQMAEADSPKVDILRGITEVSNPLLNAVGMMIKDVRDKKTVALRDIDIRVTRATKRLKGSSAFMFESSHDPDYFQNIYGDEYDYSIPDRIISDIDWKKYEAEKALERELLGRSGLKGEDLKEALDVWEEQHTEDRIVSKKSGRTERVPDGRYRKAMPILTAEQQAYYDEMMELKGELGDLFPEYARNHFMPAQKSRTIFDALAQTKGGTWNKANAVGRALLRKLKGYFKILEDDTDFYRSTMVEGREYATDKGALDNTLGRKVPIFYITKLKDQRDLVKDFSGGMMSLASTAINYKYINEIKDNVEFIGDFIKSKYNAVLKSDKTQVAQNVKTQKHNIVKLLINKSTNTNTISLLEGFISHFIYGEHIKNVGKYTKILSTLLKYNSSRKLTFNVKGSIANLTMGELQMIIEAASGEFYNFKDYSYAKAKIFGNMTIGQFVQKDDGLNLSQGTLFDYLSNDKSSMAVLLMDRFDIKREQFSEMASKRFFSGRFRKLMSYDALYTLYGIGEHILHQTTMYAILHHEKVYLNNKKVTLEDVLTKEDKKDGVSVLKIKDGAQYKDENGNLVDIDEAYLDKIRDKIEYANKACHGGMTDFDKGIIHQQMAGKFVMNLRQWMVRHYDRRFGSEKMDATLKEKREGYYNSTYKIFKNFVRAHIGLQADANLQWRYLTKHQKANVRRALAEASMALILNFLAGSFFGIGLNLGEPEPDDDWGDTQLRYQLRRALLDVNASTPIGVPTESIKIINKPIAATSTINDTLYPILGIGDITKKMQSGEHKGENKYWHYVHKYFFPYIYQIKNELNLEKNKNIYSVFEQRDL